MTNYVSLYITTIKQCSEICSSFSVDQINLVNNVVDITCKCLHYALRWTGDLRSWGDLSRVNQLRRVLEVYFSILFDSNISRPSPLRQISDTKLKLKNNGIEKIPTKNLQIDIEKHIIMEKISNKIRWLHSNFIIPVYYFSVELVSVSV